ncbi:uncharacterized protein SCODWIG_02619 [Saccharomycodes ludwigii]|uniref:V-type proton ATPase subunit S1/VOA1 transmembrane domain-containing protein n=1 Tax=Saccharomycodes ludwigii TaxID=36035 RepID=A0A376B869_9ASCO|nr:hypothetical protein SCDLUD_002319 [Saccharomycodes ludwigii]KAH3900864.1 hypothetical protein SCDLUD_002319 [Saccharomycodes ludwigii]SSD60858.1 uncharacterized protein SCODWIG_02619 [Saccharomycodes ludwigii]
MKFTTTNHILGLLFCVTVLVSTLFKVAKATEDTVVTNTDRDIKNMFSFMSLNSKVYNDLDHISSVSDLYTVANPEEPLIVLQFDSYPLYYNFEAGYYNNDYGFLSDFFDREITTVLEADADNNDDFSDSVSLFSVGDTLDISFTSFQLFKNENETSVAIFKFTGDYYNLDSLADYLNQLYEALEYKYSNIDNIVIQSAKHHKNNIKETTLFVSEDNDIIDHADTSKIVDDSLSQIWTEGLLMCLIVSFILILVLIFAIQWTSSITISYGALQKSNNPLKKVN